MTINDGRDEVGEYYHIINVRSEVQVGWNWLSFLLAQRCTLYFCRVGPSGCDGKV